jgi:type IV secretory pathway VirB4 component
MALNAKATQEFMPIQEVRDGVIVLKDGSLRAIVLANSVNLSLKSADEQRGTIMQFQNFLNTLDFSVQIVVQSRRLDIRPYLFLLENRIKVQSEPLLKLQTKEYIEFIRNFTESVAIMTKTFFVVVPYVHTSLEPNSGAFKKIFSFGRNKAEQETARQVDFEEKRSQLEQRVSVIEQGLGRCGIKTAELGTEEIVEVFYKVFNPGELEGKIEINQ